jgi:deoxyribodipyrimidine photo-lyase
MRVHFNSPFPVSDNKALALASAQAVKDHIPLVVLHVLSPQDYIAHDRSKTRIDFVLRNLSRVKVKQTCVTRITTGG